MIRWLKERWWLITGKAARCNQCRRVVRNWTSTGDWAGCYDWCLPCHGTAIQDGEREEGRHLTGVTPGEGR